MDCNKWLFEQRMIGQAELYIGTSDTWEPFPIAAGSKMSENGTPQILTCPGRTRDRKLFKDFISSVLFTLNCNTSIRAFSLREEPQSK